MSLTEQLARRGAAQLAEDDPELFALLEREYERQRDTLVLVASSGLAPPSVLAATGSVAVNVTTEGYPGARYHAGCEVVDEIERLATARARAVFGAVYANVQPHAGTTANQIVMGALLEPGDPLVGFDLRAGGHLSHGAPASASGRWYRAASYGVGADGVLDYDEVAELVDRVHPKLLVCGASAYPRTLDFERFRAIADGAGTYLLADISHIAGLVAAGVHPTPIDHAHVTTTSTYKQLIGPRGGIILLGRDADALAPKGGSLAEAVQRAVFPFLQGTPDLGSVAAKARAMAAVATPAFAETARRIVQNARALALHLDQRGFCLVAGGTDTHMVMVDLRRRRTRRGLEITGMVAERALESCGIVVNRNAVPGDRRSTRITSGMRLGTNIATLRGMDSSVMSECAELVATVLDAVVPRGPTDFDLDDEVRDKVRGRVLELCAAWPLPGYSE